MSHPNIKHFTAGDNGKGSRQRQCDRKSMDNFRENFDRIFGKGKANKEGGDNEQK